MDQDIFDNSVKEGVVFGKNKLTLQEFTKVDWKDKWNWILLCISIFLFYFGITTIIKTLSG